MVGFIIGASIIGSFALGLSLGVQSEKCATRLENEKKYNELCKKIDEEVRNINENYELLLKNNHDGRN